MTCFIKMCLMICLAVSTCYMCKWYRDVSMTENCRTGEDVEDTIGNCGGKCSRIESFSSGEYTHKRILLQLNPASVMA